MRYIAGILYGLAATAGSGLLLNSVMIGGCVAVATIAFAFAVEGIIRHELWRAANANRHEPLPRPKRRHF